jgi:hypothetical protein
VIPNVIGQAAAEFLSRKILYTEPAWLPESAWHMHLPFAFACIDLLRPRLLVELGTQKGASYCGFCEASGILNHEMRAVAIDHWKSDEHTGQYDKDTLSILRDYHDPLYSRFSTLRQSTFDEAVSDFADGSIDLLHIDGLHTYDAVRHDFETWLPKLSTRAVVLMHDTDVHKDDFGVWQLWDELIAKYPGYNFPFGYGLGVLLVGKDIPDSFASLAHMNQDQAELLTNVLAGLGKRVEYLHDVRTLTQSLEHSRELEQYAHKVYLDYRNDAQMQIKAAQEHIKAMQTPPKSRWKRLLP